MFWHSPIYWHLLINSLRFKFLLGFKHSPNDVVPYLMCLSVASFVSEGVEKFAIKTAPV